MRSFCGKQSEISPVEACVCWLAVTVVVVWAPGDAAMSPLDRKMRGCSLDVRLLLSGNERSDRASERASALR